jgi:hypothetical protein
MTDILAVYDHGDDVTDRYTVVLNWPEYGTGSEETEYMALGLSDHPDSPNMGVSQWSTAVLGPHLGKEIALDDLPENVKRHALERIQE